MVHSGLEDDEGEEHSVNEKRNFSDKIEEVQKKKGHKR